MRRLGATTITIFGRSIPLQAAVVVVALLVLLVTGLRSGLFDESPAVRRVGAPAVQTVPAAVGAPASVAGGEPVDWSAAAFDIMLKLVAVLALAYLALAVLRRYAGGAALGQRAGSIQVLETTTLAPNRLLYLVRAGDRKLLLGVTPTQITPLTTWWEMEEQDRISLGHLDATIGDDQRDPAPRFPTPGTPYQP